MRGGGETLPAQGAAPLDGKSQLTHLHPGSVSALAAKSARRILNSGTLHKKSTLGWINLEVSIFFPLDTRESG